MIIVILLALAMYLPYIIPRISNPNTITTMLNSMMEKADKIPQLRSLPLLKIFCDIKSYIHQIHGKIINFLEKSRKIIGDSRRSFGANLGLFFLQKILYLF
jgi:hypothetical protein